MHPSEDIKLKKKIFSGFLVKKYETKKYIYQSISKICIYTFNINKKNYNTNKKN